MLVQLWAVFAQRQLVLRVHGVFRGVINPLARLFADQPDKAALLIFLCHIGYSLTDGRTDVNSLYQKYRLIKPVLLDFLQDSVGTL